MRILKKVTIGLAVIGLFTALSFSQTKEDYGTSKK